MIAPCRSLYVTFKGMGQGYDKQLEQLTKVGSKLNRALEKAQGIGDWNRKMAWILAEEATKELGEVVDVYLPAKALITASGGAVAEEAVAGFFRALSSSISASAVLARCSRHAS
jgi:hypothetical protein